MNDFRFYSLLKEKIDDASETEKFKLYALGFATAPYRWGRESLDGTDCSGLISGVLMFMGYSIRTTADFFYKAMVDRSSVDGIKMVFFVDEKDDAKHVGFYISDDIIMHANGDRGVTFDYEDNLEQEYIDKGYKMFTRYLNFAKVKENDGTFNGKDEDYA